MSNNKSKGQDYYDGILERAENLVEESLDKIYEGRGMYFKFPSAKDIPKKCSFITLDLEFPKYATDKSDIIVYKDGKTMQQALLDWTEQMVTPEMLEMVRGGEIQHLTLRLGSRTLSGQNLPEDYGL